MIDFGELNRKNMRALKDAIRREYHRMVGFMPEPDRGQGGYVNAEGLIRSVPREIVLQLSPAAATASAAVEQTFTVPGLQATDRIVGFQPTTSVYSGTSALGVSFRTSAISVISVAFVNAGTSAGQPTTSARYAILTATARG